MEVKRFINEKEVFGSLPPLVISNVGVVDLLQSLLCQKEKKNEEKT